MWISLLWLHFAKFVLTWKLFLLATNVVLWLFRDYILHAYTEYKLWFGGIYRIQLKVDEFIRIVENSIETVEYTKMIFNHSKSSNILTWASHTTKSSPHAQQLPKPICGVLRDLCYSNIDGQMFNLLRDVFILSEVRCKEVGQKQ